jgi:hypothetical protein
MEAGVEKLSPLYSKHPNAGHRNYDAPKRAALIVVGGAMFVVFLMIGGVRLLAAVLG